MRLRLRDWISAFAWQQQREPVILQPDNTDDHDAER
jgi:hypothetical protein